MYNKKAFKYISNAQRDIFIGSGIYMILKKCFMILFCLLVLVPSQTRAMDKRLGVYAGGLCAVAIGFLAVRDIIKNSSFFYRSNKDGYKYKYCLAKYTIFSKKSENFKSNRNDKIVKLNNFQEMLDYVWKLITGKVVDGSGIQEERILQVFDINDVTKINVNDFYVCIIWDPTIQNNTLKIKGDDNIIPLINCKVDKNCLFIDSNDFALHPKCYVVYTCTLKRIEEITLSGNSTLSRLSQFCSQATCSYCNRYPSLVPAGRLQANDLTINLSGNAYMTVGTGVSGKIHRNIKANVSGNSFLEIGNCLKAELVALDNAKCSFYDPLLLHIQLRDNAFLNVNGGCKLTGTMVENSKLSTTRYQTDYKHIAIEFSDQNKQWVGKAYWE